MLNEYEMFTQCIFIKGDHCLTASDLGYMTERLVGYVLGQGEASVNDRYLKTDWYRMKGYTLSQSRTKKCGSVVNLYMKGNFRLQVSKFTSIAQALLVLKCIKIFAFSGL